MEILGLSIQSKTIGGDRRSSTRRPSNNDENSDKRSEDTFHPTSMYRAKSWTLEVEEAFRVQQAGWRDLCDYQSVHGDPERWSNGFIKCIRIKSNGYYTYWRKERECIDKYLNCVKLFQY